MTGSRGRGRRSSTESGEHALVAEGVDVLESCLWDHADDPGVVCDNGQMDLIDTTTRVSDHSRHQRLADSSFAVLRGDIHAPELATVRGLGTIHDVKTGRTDKNAFDFCRKDRVGP